VLWEEKKYTRQKKINMKQNLDGSGNGITETEKNVKQSGCDDISKLKRKKYYAQYSAKNKKRLLARANRQNRNNEHMIQFTKSYKTTDGQVFGSIRDAQIHELLLAANLDQKTAEYVLENKDKVIDILTTTPNSKPKARSVNGGSKKRTTVSASVPVVSTPATKPTVITAANSTVGSTNNA